MLQRLLQELVHAGRGTSLAALAQRLGVSEPLIEQMVEELTRLGYLVAFEGRCASSCTGCSRRAFCGLNVSGKVWLLTDKGRQAAGVA